jgi:DNA (cytosine-5)-methyltransferase 1
MNVLDLFSGIGGFSLGLERTGGFRTVAFCEIDPFCRRVLAKHWPEVPCYHDVNTLTKDQLVTDGISIDAIVGGFPCQDISLAGGSRLGLAGKRSGLWSEYARLIGELRPAYVIVENVSALLDNGMGDILGTLAALGYDGEWSCIPAGSIGSPTIRDRVWITAYPVRLGLARRLLAPEGLWRQAALVEQDVWDDIPEHRGHGSRNGIPDYVERITALGNAVVPQIPELIGRAILAAEAGDSMVNPRVAAARVRAA